MIFRIHYYTSERSFGTTEFDVEGCSSESEAITKMFIALDRPVMISHAEEITEKEGLEIGMEGIIHGWRWVQVEDVSDDGSGFAVDQEGEGHEVTIGDFNHIY
tara:strand:+ start:11503 stop:11811 length:309 start_codon:yes stop_codon:yes gene_type:complete